MRNCLQMLQSKWDEGNFVCVGLDSDIDKIPVSVTVGDIERTIVDFNCSIIDATKSVVCAYKPNIAFYEEAGDLGISAAWAGY